MRSQLEFEENYEVGSCEQKDAAALACGLYSLTFQLRDHFSWSSHPGSTLRGIWGKALRELSCSQKERDRCEGCPMAFECVYAHVFMPRILVQEPQPSPFVPYVIEPPRSQHTWEKGDCFQFKWIVFNKALPMLHLLLQAWVLAFKKGIGPKRVRGDLVSVVLEQDGVCYGSDDEPFYAPQLTIPDIQATSIELRHLSPMRIELSKKPLHPRELNPKEMIISLLRRIDLCCTDQTYFGTNERYKPYIEAAKRLHFEGQLEWEDEQRYSFRQMQKIPLGGVVGHWRWFGQEDDLSLLTPLLYIGQWLHVGKETVFGLGLYELDVLDSCNEV